MVKKDLSITFLGVKFPNPFCLSSSPVGNDYDMCKKAYDVGWGGIVFKTIGPKSYVINEVSPRFDTLTKEAEPFVGFKNMEQIAEHSLEENLADLARLKKDYPNNVLIASIMGNDEESWEDLARKVTEAGADMIEMNLSCPQMTSHAMGSDVGANPELCKKYCQAVKRGSKLPMMAKMTPNITDMVEVAKACLEGGADGIAAINTIKSICNVDLNKKAKDLTDEELGRIRSEVDKYLVEGELRREVNMNIKNKMEIGSYEGTRHKRNLPVRGQRTNRNARTRKGKGKVVANKKK